jgi:hypothetical protein
MQAVRGRHVNMVDLLGGQPTGQGSLHIFLNLAGLRKYIKLTGRSFPGNSLDVGALKNLLREIFGILI